MVRIIPYSSSCNFYPFVVLSSVLIFILFIYSFIYVYGYYIHRLSLLKLFKLTLEIMTKVAAVSYCSFETGFIKWKETSDTKVQYLDFK